MSTIEQVVKIARFHRCQVKKSVVIVPEDESLDTIPITAEYRTQHDPHQGGYYIKYADGTEAFSEEQP